METIARLLASLASLFAVSTAVAQTALPSFEERTGWPLPQSGIYFDPTQPGVGFLFDVGLDGTVMGGFGSYGADGRSIFYTVQGRIVRDGLAEADRGAIGLLRSPLYLSRRLGAPDAADSRVVTDAVPALGEAVVRFTEARRLTLDIAGQRWNMQRMPLTEDPSQWAAGRFLMLVEPRTGSGMPPVLAQVSIGELQPVQVPAGAPEGGCGVALPPAAARMVTCETGCDAFEAWAGSRAVRVLAWPNADSSTWQLGRFVRDGADRLVPLRGADQYTLEASHLSLDALPVARGCAAQGGALRFYRSEVPQDLPPGATSPTYKLGVVRAGIWWDPTRPGRGLVVDVGGRSSAPLAYGMVGVFDFRDDGSANFSTVEGQVLPSSSAITGAEVLSAPLYRHLNGQCIGCPWRAPSSRVDTDGLQLFFRTPQRGDLSVQRVVDSRVVGTDLYRRFSLDRSPYDEAQGRWLLRIADPALTGTSTDPATPGARVPAYAEVALTPLDGTIAGWLAPASPSHAVRCLRSCTEFSRWVRGSAPAGDTAERVAVLSFAPASLFPVPPNELTYDPASGALSVYSRGPDGWVRVDDAPYYTLDLGQRDRYATVGQGYRFSGTDALPAGRIDLFRNPPRVLVD